MKLGGKLAVPVLLLLVGWAVLRAQDIASQLAQGAGDEASASSIRVDVDGVYDGDTFYVSFPDHGPYAGQRKVRVRPNGFDTAERKNPKCQYEAQLAMRQRQALMDILGDAVVLELTGVDRYQRPLAWVYTTDGRSVSELMIKQHGARPYNGGKRKSWCEDQPG